MQISATAKGHQGAGAFPNDTQGVFCRAVTPDRLGSRSWQLVTGLRQVANMIVRAVPLFALQALVDSGSLSAGLVCERELGGGMHDRWMLDLLAGLVLVGHPDRSKTSSRPEMRECLDPQIDAPVYASPARYQCPRGAAGARCRPWVPVSCAFGAPYRIARGYRGHGGPDLIWAPSRSRECPVRQALASDARFWSRGSALMEAT